MTRQRALAAPWVFFLALTVTGQGKTAEKAWDAIVAAGKKEGRVVIAGSPDLVLRNEIIPKFQDRFGILVEYIAGSASQIANRLKIERKAGLRTVDVFMGGIGTSVGLYDEKAVDPLKPLLVLKEVTDPSKWKDGKLGFVDPEEKYVLRVFRSVRNVFMLNSAYVNPAEIRSVADLLNPKWKGKIATEDPTESGSGAILARQILLQLGEDFFRKFYVDQKPTIVGDRRLLTDSLARGTYTICLSCREDDVKSLRKDGFQFTEVFHLSDLSASTSGTPWFLWLMNGAPHPNAAQVFANWIVSKEALETYSRGYGVVTLRSDVDESFLTPGTIPRPGVNYVDESDWHNSVTGRNDQLRQRMKEIMKR